MLKIHNVSNLYFLLNHDIKQKNNLKSDILKIKYQDKMIFLLHTSKFYQILNFY